MSHSSPDILVTILTHPDLSRIGEQVQMDVNALDRGIARDFPDFSRVEGEPRSLGILHLSREAMPLNWRPGGLWVGPDSDEGELFSRDRLAKGILLTLARRVLLHLRLAEQPIVGVRESITPAVRIEDVATHFGHALVDGLREQDREALIHREPPWLRPDMMTLVLAQEFPTGVASVAALARSMAAHSPDEAAALPDAG